MPDRKLTQQVFDFEAPRPGEPPPTPAAPAASPEQTLERMSPLDRLEDWLTDPRTRRTVTELAEDALAALYKVLVDGSVGYVHQAEDCLEALARRNEWTRGPDIAPGPVPTGEDEPDFHDTIDDLLDLLYERSVSRAPEKAS